MLPPHAPPKYADRNTLWNAAEAIEKPSHFFHKTISTHLLLVAIGFCLVLSSAAEPYFQGFCGIDIFIWERPEMSISAEMV